MTPFLTLINLAGLIALLLWLNLFFLQGLNFKNQVIFYGLLAVMAFGQPLFFPAAAMTDADLGV